MYWSDEAINQKVYALTQRAFDASSDEEVSRVIWEFEDIVQRDGYGLPVQKVFLLWESKKIPTERAVIFFEDCYRWADQFDRETASALKDEVMRWTFHFLWRISRQASVR